MTRRVRPLAALAMVAMVAVFSAGCGGAGSSEGASTTAPAGTTASTATATGTGTGTGSTKNATPREKAVKFAECMRENGYPDFPDPKASGDFPTIGISVSPAVWKNALAACKDLQPPGSFSAKRTPEQQSAALKFAQCIRRNGVKDFPDPVKGEPIVDTTRIPSANTPGGLSILNAAMRKCGDVLGARAGGQG